MIRAVVATAVFVRGTLSPAGASAFIVRAFKQRRFALITSRRHLLEIYRTPGQPRLRRKYGLTHTIRRRLVAQRALRSAVLSPAGPLRICRDPNDDAPIELALPGRANYLVTEDDDIHGGPALAKFLLAQDIQPVRAAQFAQVLNAP